MFRKLFFLLLVSAPAFADLPFHFKELELKRENGFQPIRHRQPRPNTTEFLILSKSHGNAGDIRKRPGLVSGGKWRRIGYAGNDDKSVQVWRRYIDKEPPLRGRINIKNGKAFLTVLTFEGNITTSSIRSKTLLRSEFINIRNRAPGPFLIISASDTPIKESVYANARQGTPDQVILAYTTLSNDFIDYSPGRMRGAVISIQIEKRVKPLQYKKALPRKNNLLL